MSSCWDWNRTVGRLLVVVIAIASPSVLVHGLTLDTVPVGNAGNAADATGYGRVDYDYRIGSTEVTNAQYVEFLNHVDPSGENALSLYNERMTSNGTGGINFESAATDGAKFSAKAGRGNNPVAFVSWYDAIRFANWMHNGQGTETEMGAYTLGALGGGGVPIDGATIVRNVGATWFLPSEDEWYKAAYHKNDGATGNYWEYPTSTNTIPFSDEPPGSDAPDPTNVGNVPIDDNLNNGYNDGHAVTGMIEIDPALNHLADAGAYLLARSPYGTFDQAGSVWEWNEALVNSSLRGIRGGAWEFTASGARATIRNFDNPARTTGCMPPADSAWRRSFRNRALDC